MRVRAGFPLIVFSMQFAELLQIALGLSERPA